MDGACAEEQDPCHVNKGTAKDPFGFTSDLHKGAGCTCSLGQGEGRFSLPLQSRFQSEYQYTY